MSDNPMNPRDIDLENYIQKWDLRDAHLIAETETSKVYRVEWVQRPAVLKILNEVGRKYEVLGAEALLLYQGNGAVKVYCHDESALLLEYADGPKLATLVENHKEDLACEAACGLMDKIHSIQLNRSSPLASRLLGMREHFSSLFARVQLPAQSPVFTKAAHLISELIATETEVVLLHGDIHHTNILQSSMRGWLLIDPQPLFGERAYDLANLFFNPDNLPDIVEKTERIQFMAEYFAKRLKLEKKRILKYAFCYGALSSSWALDDGKDPARRMRILSLFERCL